MADISNITLPNGENYDIKDTTARNDISLNRTTLGTQCKNLLKNNAVTTTINGVTFTVNDDKSITVTGKANDSTKQTIFIFANNSTLKKTIKSGKYILSGCPSGGSSSTYRMFAYHINPSTNIADDGNGVTGDFDYSNTTDSNIAIVIAKGYTDNINLTFYPMLRYADIQDDTYEQYQPSLKEQVPYSISLPSKSTSESYSYNGVPTMICLTPSESVSSGGGLYLINSVGTAVYLIDKTGIVINTDTTNKTFTITNNTASTYDVYISCAYKKE